LNPFLSWVLLLLTLSWGTICVCLGLINAEPPQENYGAGSVFIGMLGIVLVLLWWFVP